MATQRQYVNILGRFSIITVILLAFSTQKAQASENYFLKVEKNTNIPFLFNCFLLLFTRACEMGFCGF